MNQLQKTAISWLIQGIVTIPISYRSKRPNFSALAKTGDIENGRPTWERMKTELPTKQDIMTWYSGLSNIAIVTGWKNLVIVDFDNEAGYELWLALYGVRYADTYTVSTGRGHHLYYYIEDMPQYTMSWFGGEIKSSGYCLIPPSTHPSGTAYKATNFSPIMTIGSIYDILPESVFQNEHEAKVGGPCILNDVWSPSLLGVGSYSEIKEQVSIAEFFPKAAGNGRWLSVKCPFHDDNHKSGWVDLHRNRFGCHACMNGSLSVIDFYARLNSCDAETAVLELSR